MAQTKKNANMNTNTDDDTVTKRESSNSITPLFGPINKRRSSNISNSFKSKKKNTNISKSSSMPTLRLGTPEKTKNSFSKKNINTISPLLLPRSHQKGSERSNSNVSSNTTYITGLPSSYFSTTNAFSTKFDKNSYESTRRDSHASSHGSIGINSRVSANSTNSDTIPGNFRKLRLNSNSSSITSTDELNNKLNQLNKDIHKNYYSHNKILINNTYIDTIEQYKNFYTKNDSNTDSPMTDKLRKLNKDIRDNYHKNSKKQLNSNINSIQEYRKEYTKKQSGGKINNKKLNGGGDAEIFSCIEIANKGNRIIYKFGIKSTVDNSDKGKFMFIKIYKYNKNTINQEMLQYTSEAINNKTFNKDINSRDMIPALYEGMVYEYFNKLTNDSTENVEKNVKKNAKKNAIKSIKSLGLGVLFNHSIEITDPDIADHYHNINIYQKFKDLLELKDHNIYTYLITNCDDNNITFKKYFKEISDNKIINIVKRAKNIIDNAFTNYGFIHGDLHPENILINRETEEIYLFDFDMSEIGGLKTLAKYSSDIESKFPYILPFMFYILSFNEACFNLFMYKTAPMPELYIRIHKCEPWLRMMHAYDIYRLSIERNEGHAFYSNIDFEYYFSKINVDIDDNRLRYLYNIYKIRKPFANINDLMIF